MGDLRWAGRHTQTLFSLGLAALVAGSLVRAPCAKAQSLPEAPSELLAHASVPAPTAVTSESLAANTPDVPSSEVPALANVPQTATAAQANLPPCPKGKPAGSPPAGAPVVAQDKTDKPCMEENPLQTITAAKQLPPLTTQQKGYLAVRDVIDPFNLITILGYSAVAIGANAHTAYGPGFLGFGRLTGYSLVEDMQGEFFGTFLIPTLAHEDPRYYRMPGRPFPRRLLNAVSHTVVTRHDDGSRMPNYATLLTYPISAELTNLYVPGVAGNAPDTAKRIALGLATDPVGGIVAEFLPDVAKRIHIRIIFVQQILQQVAQGGAGGPVANQ